MKFSLVIIVSCMIGINAICPNSCSGHGSCDNNDMCHCHAEGKSVYFGHLFDTAKGYNRINKSANGASQTLSTQDESRVLSKGSFVQAQWTGADCSLKTCSRGVSWTQAHNTDKCNHADFAECSDQGTCDRSSGQCTCFAGYTGAACQRSECPNGCSNHGICQSNIAFSVDASIPDASSAYGQDKKYVGAWDSGVHYGCKCSVGYRGPDCSQKECPSGADPLGYRGNESGEDCSGRGLCDFSSGSCQCFSGFTGPDCSNVEALA